MRAPQTRDERGAVAVLVSVMLVVLIGVAALAFDLGNAWARARAVQLQADVSAMSAGHLLPMTGDNSSQIAGEVADYMNRNQPQGGLLVEAGTLLDGDPDNGEVTFSGPDDGPCSPECVEMTVLTPPAAVDFAFAGVIQGGDGTDLQRQATVRAFSELPPMEDVIPLWLPSGCGYGAVDGDTTQGGGSTTDPVTVTATPTPTPTPTEETTSPSGSPSTSPPPTAAPFTVSPIGSHTLSGPAKAVARGGQISVAGWNVEDVPSNTRKASLRLVAPDGSFFVDYAVSESSPRGTLTVPTFQIGPEVSSTSGTWLAYGLLEANGNGRLEYSRTSIEVVVSAPVTTSPSDSASAGPSPSAETSAPASSSPSASAIPTSVPVGCAGQDRGNFGQLDSPRRGVGNAKDTLAANLALGLDHLLVPFDFGDETPTKSCSSGGAPIAGAVFDDVSQDGNNCIMGNTGNDGPGLYTGLIEGDGYPGRLDVANGPTDCAGRADRTVGDRVLNDDVLSCFLLGGATLSDISQDSGVTTGMLDQRVMDSPRFVWLPMVVATDRAQKEFQPILDFVPAFITGETATVNGAATPADNGVEVNGRSVKVVRLFAFNEDALPIEERSATTDYRPELGRPLARLVG